MIKKIVKNEYLFSILTRFVTLLISLAQSVFLARFLGASLQGTYSYIFSVTSITGVITTFGMHQAYPYFRKERGKEKIFNDYLSIITVIFLIYLIIAILLFSFLNLKFDTRISLLVTPILMYSNIIEYVALIEDPNKRNFKWTIIYAVQVIYVFILFVFMKSNYWLMLSIFLFPNVAKLFVFLNQLKFKFVFRKEQFKLAIELAKFGFFPMIALLLTTLNYKIDILMLNQYDCITKAMIGVYSIGMDFADKVALIPDTLKGVLVSRLAKGAGEKEVARVSRLCFWVSCLICIGFVVLGEPFINLLYGKEYNGAYSVLVICGIGSIFVGYFKLIAQYNIIQKKQIRNVILLSGSIIINIILNICLIPKYQLNGAAFASGVGYFLTGIIFVIWFAKSNFIRIREMFLPQKEDFEMLKLLVKEKI